MRSTLRVLAGVLCFALLAFAHGARAQLVLSSADDSHELWPHVRLLGDPSRALDPEKAIAAREHFVRPGGAYATLGMGKEIVWLRIPVSIGPGGEGTWFLDIDYALLHQVDIFMVRDGKADRHVKVGNGLPFESRPLRGRTHAVPLEFAPEGTTELLLRVDTFGAKLLPMTLSRLPAFHARALGEQLLQGALGGLALFLILYSLTQWVSMREDLYLKYALLVVCSATFSVHFFGIGEMYIWTDNAWFQTHMAGVSALMAAAATALFIEDALAGDLHPWLRQGLRGVAIVHVVASVAHGFDMIDIRVVAVLMTTTGLAPSLMGLPGALARARRGDEVGAWFMLAWVGYFIASAIMVGVVRGVVDASFWTLHSFQIGATLDMLVFLRIASLRTAARHRAAQRAAQERDTLHSLAHSDPLTGLLNRRGFDEALLTALERAAPERAVALYVLDLDGFKGINDRFGHDVGDQLLRVVAQRLRGSVRSGDGVARIGGDEFVIIASGFTHESQARDLGLKVLDSFHSPFVFDNQNLRMSVTIGYALAPTDSWKGSELLKAADAAMYAGKQEGKDRLLRIVR
ncbi:diguanylate cyclase [Usitatibacter palustris]|uniref:diguanylate cyclase n=1 Tax=Usitatibacter palustris TaxID=2732487 RepID=UPI0014890DC2|nr:diguanylate cyclase [Usitatibacter palustris]